MEELHISAYCSSEKEDVGIRFGLSFDPNEDSVKTIGDEWIHIGMSDSLRLLILMKRLVFSAMKKVN